MIEKVNDISELSGFYRDDLFYVRIMSLAKAYGFSYDFAVFYRQLDSDNRITAIISKLDFDFTLCFNENADTNEISEFISVLGYSTLLCDASFNHTAPYTQGVIMVSDKKVEIPAARAEIDKYPKLMELFNFVDYDTADFESWYVDISHRIRHGCARAYTLNINGVIIASGIFSSIYNNDAVLSAVRTSEEYRGLGYGSALVSEMSGDIKGKIYLMREKELNEQFYKRLGFKNNGNWRMYK